MAPQPDSRSVSVRSFEKQQPLLTITDATYEAIVAALQKVADDYYRSPEVDLNLAVAIGSSHMLLKLAADRVWSTHFQVNTDSVLRSTNGIWGALHGTIPVLSDHYLSAPASMFLPHGISIYAVLDVP